MKRSNRSLELERKEIDKKYKALKERTNDEEGIEELHRRCAQHSEFSPSSDDDSESDDSESDDSESDDSDSEGSVKYMNYFNKTSEKLEARSLEGLLTYPEVLAIDFCKPLIDPYIMQRLYRSSYGHKDEKVSNIGMILFSH